MAIEARQLRARGPEFCLVDNVKGVPLPVPLFDSAGRAEGFLVFLRGFGLTEPQTLPADALARMHERWREEGQPSADEDEPPIRSPRALVFAGGRNA